MFDRFFDAHLPFAFENRHISVFINARDPSASRLTLDIRLIFVHRKIDDMPVDQFLHLVNMLVFGIENGIAFLRNGTRHDRFDARQIFERVDVF